MKVSYPLEVIEKRSEGQDAVTLRLSIPDDLKDAFRVKSPGQFVGISAQINGEEVHRSYSLSSEPGEISFFEISVKKVSGGKMSTYLIDELCIGEKLETSPPAGSFYKEHELSRHHVMFAAGSGAAPMISIIKYLLKNKSDDRITLFYWNQNTAKMMFKKELEGLSESKKINLYLSFTREKVDPAASAYSERCSQEILKDAFYKWSVTLKSPVFYLCGPEEFMEEVEFFLGTKGYDSSQIRKESFNIGEKHSNIVGSLSRETGPVLIGDISQKIEDYTAGDCEAILDGELVQTSPEPDETILEAFLREGESPPYSCMEGTCLACQCKVLKGLVEMPRDSFISEDEIKEGLVLSCQAKMRSKKVKVDFDGI